MVRTTTCASHLVRSSNSEFLSRTLQQYINWRKQPLALIDPVRSVSFPLANQIVVVGRKNLWEYALDCALQMPQGSAFSSLRLSRTNVSSASGGFP